MSRAEKILGRILLASWVIVWALGVGFILLVYLVRPAPWRGPWLAIGSAIRPLLIVHVLLTIGFGIWLLGRGTIRLVRGILSRGGGLG